MRFVDFCAGNVGGGLDMMWNNAFGIGGSSGWFGRTCRTRSAVRVVDVQGGAHWRLRRTALPQESTGSLMFSTSSPGHLWHAA